MPELPFLILILLAGLGPMRAVPAFAAMTADATPKQRLRLASLSVGVATVIVLVLAFAGAALRRTWDIPWAAASVAAGLVLISFASVLTAINTPVGHVLWSLDATTSAVLLALVRGGALVLAAYAFADKGATGLAGAYVIMGVVQTIANIPFLVWLLRRKLTPVAAREEVAVA